MKIYPLVTSTESKAVQLLTKVVKSFEAQLRLPNGQSSPSQSAKSRVFAVKVEATNLVYLIRLIGRQRKNSEGTAMLIS